MSFGGGHSSTTTNPVDMTPAAFRNLQGPFAQRLAQLLGFGVSNGRGGGSGTNGLVNYNIGPQGPGTPGYGGGGGNASQRGVMMDGQFIPFIGNTQSFNYNGANYSSSGNEPGPNGGQWFTVSSPEISGSAGGTTGTRRVVLQAVNNPNTSGGGNGFNGWGDFSGGDVLSGIPTYKGPLTADMTDSEKALLAKLMNPGQSTAETYLNGLLTANPNSINPFLSAAITAAQRPTLQGLEETLTRDLPGRFTQAGQFIQPGSSSAFDRAAAIATRGAADANSDIATKLAYQSYDSDAARRLQAATSLPGVQGAQIDNLIKNLQAQALPRMIQQNGIDKGIELFNKQVDDLLKVLGITAGVTQPTIANSSNSRSNQFQFGLPSS